MKNIYNTNNKIDAYGNVFFDTGKPYAVHINQDGYKTVRMQINGNRKTFRIHRLVGEHFVPNIYNKPEINHIDGDKLNNHFSNLEWCTHSENIKHAWNNGLLKSTTERSNKIRAKCAHFGKNNHKSKKVRGVTANNEFTDIFECARDAAKIFDTDQVQISRSANMVFTKDGKQRSAGKMNNEPIFWSFIND